MQTLLILLFAYFVSFLDKPEKTAPQLSPRAVEQRDKWHIPTDQMDYPVSTLYMDSLRRMGVKIYHKSRWFNGVTCEMKPELAEQVRGLSFVTAVEMTRDDSAPIYSSRKRRIPAWQNDQTMTDENDAQLAFYNLQPLHAAGFEGQGILMAVCDGGFQDADKLTYFRQKQELGHFDFTDDTYDFYGESGSHGTMCLSTISAIYEGSYNSYYGAATEANYYLMRSEENDTESPKEMDNLVVALEKADSLGVNIFSVSLGYAMFDNGSWTLDKTTDLDGRSTRSSYAATIAARKGMLVVVAAGNEGDDNWHTISSPADADSVLTVGAASVDSLMGGFSSYGPTSDERIKPEVCAVGAGVWVMSPYGFPTTSNGTSFATPLMAGFAACLWSALPDENALQIRERIIRSANRYIRPDPNYHFGYGIPDAWKAYTMTLEEGIESTRTDETPGTKILRNGKIYILRGNKIYDLMGRALEE